MSITREQILAATQLTTAALSEALNRNGYEDEKIVYAEFRGMTEGGVFVYAVEYDDLNGEGDRRRCRIYARFRKDPVTKFPYLIAGY